MSSRFAARLRFVPLLAVLFEAFFAIPLLLRQAGGPLTEFVDQLRGLGLREVLVEGFSAIVAQGFEVRPLRRRHWLVAGLPLVGVALQARLVHVLCVHNGEAKAKRTPISWAPATDYGY